MARSAKTKTTESAQALVALLRSDAVEKQIAATIVIGELGIRDAGAVDGLLALVDSGLGPLQRHALEALTRLQASGVLEKALPLLAARDENVRAAALGAVVAAGEAAVPAVRARLANADGEERRALEAALARLGGKDAFSALLQSLDADGANPDASRAAILAVRQRIKDAGARERQGYVGQVVKYLGAKKTRASVTATAGALKILGFLEDGGSVNLLLTLAGDKKQADAVREEAVIALRFASREKTAAQAKVATALLAIAETAPGAVARAALYTLAGIALPPPLVARLQKLAAHPEGERARLAIERLARTETPAAADALGKILLGTGERARAEAAGTALAARPDAGAALARALLVAPDADRAWMLVKMLRPHVRKLDPRQVTAVRDEALARLRANKPAWEPFLQVAREADARITADGLRRLVSDLRKGKKLAQALAVARLLGSSAEAFPEDGYALATLELAAGKRDEALLVFGQLADRGFDVAATLRRDRAVEPEQRYQIGFHFADKHHPLGEEILTAIVEAGGRSKVVQMAKAKLRSAGFAE
ncbi:MAG TPA: hypothetical protein VGL59_02485 [Polyangia bacterium]|jgi:hypothetical protein